MKELTARQREDGYWVCEFVNPQGGVESHVGSSPEVAIAKAQKAIEKKGGTLGWYLRDVAEPKARGKRGNYRPRSPIHSAQWGRPTNKQFDYRRSLEMIFGEIRARAIMGTTAAASATNLLITEATAKELLKNIYKSRGKYNTYTGNLERAYKASIITGRKARASVFLDDTPKGNEPIPSKRSGSLKVYAFPPLRHKLGKVRQNSYRRWKKRRKGLLDNDEYMRVPYRYFKNFELKRGYRNKGWVSGRDGKMGGFQYQAHGGPAKGSVQSGIIFENTAPYAAAVEAAGYRVMPPGAYLRSYNMRNSSKKKTLSISITKNMLKAAGLIK